jgi:periplasmic protein CpxP/Spy
MNRIIKQTDMKNLMKIGMLTLALSLGYNSYAQEPKHDKVDTEQRIDMRLDKLEKELNLNPEQKAQLREIHLASWQKKKELSAQMRTVEQEKKEQVKAVLTAEQLEKMKELHKQKQQKMKKKRGATCNCGHENKRLDK